MINIKKLGIILLFLLCLTSCDKKEEQVEPAELKFNQSGEQIALTVHPTENPEEVSNTLNTMLDYGSFDVSDYNGARFDLSSNIAGNVDINTKEKSTAIQLDYTFNSSVTTNLKKCQMEGIIRMNGSSSTLSETFSMKSNNKCEVGFQNDDENLYLSASLSNNDNRLGWRLKTDISSFISQYKGTIIGILDILEYYPISNIIEDVDEFVKAYKATIAETTKDTITFGLYVPTEKVESKLYLKVRVSCQSLLPVHLEIEANEFIKEILAKKYIEEYLSEDVIVNKASFSLQLDILYGKYQIGNLSDAQKNQYKQVDYQVLIENIKNFLQ